jgi:hypothetical protein
VWEICNEEVEWGSMMQNGNPVAYVKRFSGGRLAHLRLFHGSNDCVGSVSMCNASFAFFLLR